MENLNFTPVHTDRTSSTQQLQEGKLEAFHEDQKNVF